MKTSFYRFAALLLFAAALTAGCGERTDDMRLLYWNCLLYTSDAADEL